MANDKGSNTSGLYAGFKKPGTVKREPSSAVPNQDSKNSSASVGRRAGFSLKGKQDRTNGDSVESPHKKNAFIDKHPTWKLPAEEVVEEVKLPTADELEAIRKSAYEEGFQSGKEQGQKVGFKHGLSEGQKEIDATVARLKQVMQALFEPIQQQDEALESVLLDCVISICRLILKRELKIDSSQILQILKEAFATLKVGHKNVKIHLHPRDAELVEKKLSEFQDYSEKWRIVQHATLSPGGCIVETDSSLLNASLDQRVNQVIQQIYDQEVLRLPGHADEILDKEERYQSESFADLAEEITDEQRRLPNSDIDSHDVNEKSSVEPLSPEEIDEQDTNDD